MSSHAPDIEQVADAESERVTAWRACELLKAGYEPQVAVELAEQSEVDLHLALDLLERGCSPSLAAKILL